VFDVVDDVNDVDVVVVNDDDVVVAVNESSFASQHSYNCLPSRFESSFATECGK